MMVLGLFGNMIVWKSDKRLIYDCYDARLTDRKTDGLTDWLTHTLHTFRGPVSRSIGGRSIHQSSFCLSGGSACCHMMMIELRLSTILLTSTVVFDTNNDTFATNKFNAN
eukprot:Selendium_serpulae@DN2556_c0_g1_i1.p1